MGHEIMVPDPTGTLPEVEVKLPEVKVPPVELGPVKVPPIKLP